MPSYLRGLCLSALALCAVVMPAEAKPQAGKVFDDWVVECEKPENMPEKCFAAQNLSTQEKQRVLKFSVGYLGPKGEAMVVAILPLGLSIPIGAAFKVDERPQVPLTLLHCLPEGCVASAPLKDDEMAALKSGKSAIVGFQMVGTQTPVGVPVSLKGFGSALGSLK